MAVQVTSSLEDSEKGEASRDGSVEAAEEDEGRDHEGEGDLSVKRVEGAKGRCGHVLVTGEAVDDAADDAEDDEFGNGASPERFGKISRVAHLRNETRDGDLTDKGVADVEECRHALNKGGGLGGSDTHNRVAHGHSVSLWLTLDPGEDDGKQDRDEGKEGRCRAELGHHVKRSGQREDPANNHHDDTKLDRSAATNVVGLGHGVEVLCTDENM